MLNAECCMLHAERSFAFPRWKLIERMKQHTESRTIHCESRVTQNLKQMWFLCDSLCLRGVCVCVCVCVYVCVCVCVYVCVCDLDCIVVDKICVLLRYFRLNLNSSKLSPALVRDLRSIHSVFRPLGPMFATGVLFDSLTDLLSKVRSCHLRLKWWNYNYRTL